MTREWRVGDAVRYAGGISVVVDTGCHGLAPHWHHTGGAGGWDRLEDRASFGGKSRLVVIDPESEEELRRIGDLLVEQDRGYDSDSWRDLRAALRCLINPQPPEPTGLGAVVECDPGPVYDRAWAVRAWSGDTFGGRPWNFYDSSGNGGGRHYCDLPVVKVLSEGVRL